MNIAEPDEPLVSIIINCYNGEKYLNDAINSVLQQTYKNWEIIFWDNQSNDHSAEIAKSYKDTRIRYFYAEHHTNLGKARNLALMNARGDWVAFLDVDDLWFPEKLTTQLRQVLRGGRNVGISYSRCEIFGSFAGSNATSYRKKIIPKIRDLPQENLANELFVGNFIPFTSVLYKREALESIGGVPSYKHPPDYYMSLAISLKWKNIAIDQVLCAYRVHQDNLSLSLKESGYRESIEIVQKLSLVNQVFNKERYHRFRLIVYLISEGKFRDAHKEFSTLGCKDFLLSLIGVLRHNIKYY